MAQQRPRTPTRKPLSNTVRRETRLDRIKSGYALRQLSKRALLKKSDDSHGLGASRPVLVPLHTNLRSLPSRYMAPLKHREKYDTPEGTIGTKRKRLGNGTDNSNILRHVRCGGRFKRQRSQNDSSDDENYPVIQARMELDSSNTSQSCSSDTSEGEEPLLDDSDDFLINEAEDRQLNRLRKDELARLHTLAGLTTTEDMTKHELVNSLISARIDAEEEVPPSSPSGRTDYSSDEGHYGGGEETDVNKASNKAYLRRRATDQDLSRPAKKAPVRTLSMGVQETSRVPNAGKKLARISTDIKSPTRQGYGMGQLKRRSVTAQSSPGGIMNTLPSPPATRLRSRTISNEHRNFSNSTTSTSMSMYEEIVPDASISSPRKRRTRKAKHVDFESATTSNDGSAASRTASRLLRSNSTVMDDTCEDQSMTKRVTPMRKAKKKVICLKEDSTSIESDEEDGSVEQSDDEIDELDSSPSGSPEPRQNRYREQRTPLKKRLRPRNVPRSHTPSDGDDEEEDELGEIGAEAVSEIDEEGSADDDDEKDDDEAVESNEDITFEPRILRNGKIVGETEVDELEEVEEEVEEAEDDLDDASVSASDIEVDEDSETAIEEFEEADEVMEDEFDLSNATKKTLVRLRRDDLIKLCECRDLTVEGTKPQLVQALLQWRDSQEASTSSAPSSSSTAKPVSTIKLNGRRPRTRSQSKSSSGSPLLMRQDRFHDDEPVTPPISKEKKDADGDLELDLESLGLEDREIPPDKLTKLEKIGSGGFKDVYIGKFKGRKVALAEFRDQLSAMDIKELKLLAEFAHPNIVRFLGVSIPESSRETPMIVSELCANGDLFDYIRNVPAPSLYRVLSIMLDIAKGLHYLHERNPSVIHRDCKSSNILITSKGSAKIADFGLAKVKQSTRSMVRSLVGTVNWQAPELWAAHPKYNHKVDVFSCACVFWEMLQWHLEDPKYPWEGMNEHAIYEAVGQKRQRPSLNGLRRQWCPEIVELIDRMWAQNAQDRPGMVEIVDEISEIIKKYR